VDNKKLKLLKSKNNSLAKENIHREKIIWVFNSNPLPVAITKRKIALQQV